MMFDGDILELIVGYSGGCAEHRFELCWNGIVGDDLIPEIQIKLGHDSGGDMCEAYFMETLRFDAAWLGAELGSTVNVELMLLGGGSISALYESASKSEK
jgi:hypothetical protein